MKCIVHEDRAEEAHTVIQRPKTPTEREAQEGFFKELMWSGTSAAPSFYLNRIFFLFQGIHFNIYIYEVCVHKFNLRYLFALLTHGHGFY